MMNTVNLIGRLTRDVELRYTNSGKAVTNVTLAVNRNFTDNEGNQAADFIPVVLWGKLAENLANYNGKGSLISVTGRIQTRTYEASAGHNVYVTEVVAERVDFLSQPKSHKESTPSTHYITQDDLPNTQQVATGIHLEGGPVPMPDELFNPF